ncbi:PIG-L deacetylase family protein [Erythrobacter sp. R86502]|uniref:PIG-L deacetylase family protein n=1 Tax=Erythrobacter sp. R86502 TaxID=3093846 RepID=UPI0036D29DA0
MSLPTSPKGALLSAAADAPPIEIDELSPPGGLLIIAPHPDDETFGCGQALAAAAQAGREIGVLLLTDGAGSHPGSASYDRERLVKLRKDELDAALALLAPGKTITVMRAGLEDGCSDLEQLGLHRYQRIVAYARALRAKSVWATWNGDPHCDHTSAATLGRMISDDIGVGFWRYSIWGRFGERDVPHDLRLFSDGRFEQRKRDAIAAYRSQTTRLIDDDPDGFVFPQEILEHFAQSPEIFIGG